jgi:hypothetical protein
VNSQIDRDSPPPRFGSERRGEERKPSGDGRDARDDADDGDARDALGDGVFGVFPGEW